jgi:hypothetical protein
MKLGELVFKQRGDILEKVSSVVFTSDLLKVDDRLPERLPNPQRINIEWLHALFSPLAEKFTGQKSRLLVEESYPDQLSRLRVFRELGLEFSSGGWAALYEELAHPEIETAIAQRFLDTLVISFELPPYMEAIFRRHDIAFIDLTIHPIRFLPDYMFGIRSNVREISLRAHAMAVPASLFHDFARISVARSTRSFRGKKFEPGSAVFLGQIEVDASLIERGRIVDFEDVESAVLDLSRRHSRVYYKAHPHTQTLDRQKSFIAGLQRCEWLEANVYDLFSRPEIEVFGSMSSGSLLEATVFSRETRFYMDKPRKFDLSGLSAEEVFAESLYVAAPPSIFNEDYWAYLLGAVNAPSALCLPSAADQALRSTLGMKWGR